MSEYLALCPQCRKDTVFVENAGLYRCSQCGFHTEVSPPPPSLAEPSGLAPAVGDVFRLLLRGLLILCAVVLVTVAVLFAGCVFLLSRH